MFNQLNNGLLIRF